MKGFAEFESEGWPATLGSLAGTPAPVISERLWPLEAACGGDRRPGPHLTLASRSCAEGGDDVREHVGDLVAHGQKNHDDDDRNEHQDQGVLDHSLAALAADQVSQLDNYLLSRNLTDGANRNPYNVPLQLSLSPMTSIVCNAFDKPD